MTISINTKDTGETTLHIIAATISEAIQKLDRARTALWDLDEAAPPLPDIPNALNLDQLIQRLAPIADNTDPQEQTPPPAAQDLSARVATPSDAGRHLSAPPHQEQKPPPATSDSPSLPSVLSIPSVPDDQPPTAEELRKEISDTGLHLFGEDWSRAHTWLITLWTTTYTPTNIRNSIDLLNAEECNKILTGMIDHAPETKVRWQEHLQKGAAKAQQPALRPQPVQRRENGRQQRATAQPITRRPAAESNPDATPIQVAAANDPVYATG